MLARRNISSLGSRFFVNRGIWTYSFKVKDDVFSGELGAFGSWLFRVRFREGEYAAMMKDVLRAYKQDAEERQAAWR